MKCKGCGVELQYDYPTQIGYTPKIESLYCQRCFRLTHYDDVMFSLKQGIDSSIVLEQLKKEDGIIAWVVDLFDFESGFLPHFNETFENRDIILIVTKTDLLKNVLTLDKLETFIENRLKEKKIKVNGIIASGLYGKDNGLYMLQQLKLYSQGKTVIVAGKANAGKSTFLNQISNNNQLTTSRYPGTTIDFNQIELDGLTLLDTPGIEGSHSIIMSIEEKDLKKVCPIKPINAQVFQYFESQTYFIAGLVRIDIINPTKGSIVFYNSNQLKIHRTNYNNADTIWAKRGSLLKPTIKNDFKQETFHQFKEKQDFVIDGLGWFTINGDYEKIMITLNKGIYLTNRKAMI